MTAYATPEQLRHMIQAAGLAPSVHNTRPWEFSTHPTGLVLRGLRSRQLPVLDPEGRQWHLSCGAALFHARAAGRALGLDVEVHLLPDPSEPDLLAVLEVTVGAAPAADDIHLAAAILHRHTTRTAFADRPVPRRLVDDLRLSAEREGASLSEVDDDRVVELEVLLARADAEEERDPDYRAELRRWVPSMDPTALAMVAGSSLRQRDFALNHPGRLDGSAPPVDRPLVLVLASSQDDRLAWLRAGQALAAVLLRAADADVQAQPLGQVTDRLAYRYRLRQALGLVDLPQLVLRLGYPAVTGPAVTGPTAPRGEEVDGLVGAVGA